ncbi:hypothetical protein K1719_035613 [Acacia pycnantha]|nr:hypothetical protein K1719_035613 [Acacia pycnantha]
MQHTVPFDSSLKTEPPPHPGDDHSTKRAKFDDSDSMDSSEVPDSVPPSSAVSAIPDQEFVPETPLHAIAPSEQDVPMTEGIANSCPNAQPSFKDKLLNSDSKASGEEDDDLVLQQGDVSIGLNGNVPTVDFASHVLETLNQKMGLAVVIKLMGRRIGYRQLRMKLQNLWKPIGQCKLIDLEDDYFLVRFKEDLDYQNALLNGPWVIFGHYLTVHPWSPSFRPQEHVINQVMGWIRLPNLPARYYHKSIICSIGSVFGEVIRVDYNTDSGDRGKFARLAVSIDLTKPLISKIQVDGEIIFVEYEGLPTICFACGRYGHLQDSCPERVCPNTSVHRKATTPHASEAPSSRPAQQERESVNFGDWMVVQRRPRRAMDRVPRKITPQDGRNVASSSRYEVLNEVDPLVEERQTVYVQESEKPPQTEGNFQNKKGKEKKAIPRASTGNNQKVPAPLTKNQDSIFTSPHYVARSATTSLDGDHNSAVLIDDNRMPHRNTRSGATSEGPSIRPNTIMDPLSISRGIKLASGVTLHNMGARPNLEASGPSVRLMKEMARGLHNNLEGPDREILPEGVIFNPSPSL